MGKSNQLYYGSLWPAQDLSPVTYKNLQKKILATKKSNPANHPPQFQPSQLHLESQGQIFFARLFAALAFHQMAGAGTQEARALAVKD